jgi:hypothetical protein
MREFASFTRRPTNLDEQNRAREFSVPPEVMRRLLARWEPLDLTEAHRIEVIILDSRNMGIDD